MLPEKSVAGNYIVEYSLGQLRLCILWPLFISICFYEVNFHEFDKVNFHQAYVVNYFESYEVNFHKTY